MRKRTPLVILASTATILAFVFVACAKKNAGPTEPSGPILPALEFTEFSFASNYFEVCYDGTDATLTEGDWLCFYVIRDKRITEYIHVVPLAGAAYANGMYYELKMSGFTNASGEPLDSVIWMAEDQVRLFMRKADNTLVAISDFFTFDQPFIETENISKMSDGTWKRAIVSPGKENFSFYIDLSTKLTDANASLVKEAGTPSYINVNASAATKTASIQNLYIVYVEAANSAVFYQTLFNEMKTGIAMKEITETDFTLAQAVFAKQGTHNAFGVSGSDTMIEASALTLDATVQGPYTDEQLANDLSLGGMKGVFFLEKTPTDDYQIVAVYEHMYL